MSCPDLLDEERWPGYVGAPLARGVRCTLTLVRRPAPAVVALTLYARGPGCCPPVTCRPGCGSCRSGTA